MKIQKINPCPAGCEHEPKLIHDVANNPVQVWHVECACGWKGPFGTSETEAIDAWNKPPRQNKLEIDKDGRGMMLPCKPGDTVYRISDGQKEKVTSVGFDDEGVFVGTEVAFYRENYFEHFISFTRKTTKTALESVNEPRPMAEWNEDIGDVLWWKFPIEEPPYCGTPLDADWPGYHTHFTTFESPEISENEYERLANTK